MNPDYMLPELLEQIPKWTMIEDCYHGQDAIAKKARFTCQILALSMKMKRLKCSDTWIIKNEPFL